MSRTQPRQHRMTESDAQHDVVAPLQHSILEALTDARRYNAWVASLVRPYLGNHPIEVGGGLGDHAAIWLANGVPRVTVTERDADLVAYLERRFAGERRVAVQHLDLNSIQEGWHSAVVAINVLEHIREDCMALRRARTLLAPGGAVVIFVPAFELAMSGFDRAIGHYRRYTKRSLGDAFAHASLQIETLRYVNALGLPAWILGMRLLHLTPRNGALVRMWDRLAIPIGRGIEARFNPPFGQSLLGVARAS